MVAIRKLFKDISSRAAEAANEIKRRGYNRHHMDLLKSLFDGSHTVGKKNESLYRDIATVIAEEEGTDTGSAQGNYEPAAPVSCQKFGAITILLLHKLLAAARSVGIVFVEVESDHQLIPFGTCFRLGTKYVMTCKHVLDLAIEHLSKNRGKVLVEFNYLKDFVTFEPQRFLIKKDVVLNDVNDLDYCVLEFAIPEGQSPLVQTQLPELGPLVRDVEHLDTTGISLVGHPGGDTKVMDPSCPYPHPDVKFYLKLNPEPKGDFSQLNDQRRVTYSSVMGPGSSGAPGFDEDGNLVVMHARGYRPHGQNIEQGIKMTAIRDDLRNKNPALCEELFPTPQGSSIQTTS